MVVQIVAAVEGFPAGEPKADQEGPEILAYGAPEAKADGLGVCVAHAPAFAAQVVCE